MEGNKTKKRKISSDSGCIAKGSLGKLYWHDEKDKRIVRKETALYHQENYKKKYQYKALLSQTVREAIIGAYLQNRPRTLVGKGSISLSIPLHISIKEEKIHQLLPYLGISLWDWAQKQTAQTRRNWAPIFVYQLATSLALLHPTLAHGDISPNNITVTEETASSWKNANLVDWGSASILMPQATNCPLGTLCFSAPEVHMRLVTEKKLNPATLPFHSANDIFSLGLIFCYLWDLVLETETSTFQALQQYESVHWEQPKWVSYKPYSWCLPNFIETCSLEERKLFQIIKRTLMLDVSSRPTAVQLAYELKEWITAYKPGTLVSLSKSSPPSLTLPLSMVSKSLDKPLSGTSVEIITNFYTKRAHLINNFFEFYDLEKKQRKNSEDLSIQCVTLCDSFMTAQPTMSLQIDLLPYTCAIIYLITILFDYAKDVSMAEIVCRYVSREPDVIPYILQAQEKVLEVLETLHWNVLHCCVDWLQNGVDLETLREMAQWPCFPTLSHAQLQDIGSNLTRNKKNIGLTSL